MSQPQRGYQQTTKYLLLKERQDARKFYEQQLEKNPSMPRYLHMMGSICSETGEVKKAESYFKNAININMYDKVH